MLPMQAAFHSLGLAPASRVATSKMSASAGLQQNNCPAFIRSLQVLEMVRPAASRRGLETPVELWGYFVEQCRQRLHVVLCMSPIGNAFRDRLRQNPSLINCCTIDWFQVCLCSTRCLCCAQTGVHRADQATQPV